MTGADPMTTATPRRPHDTAPLWALFAAAYFERDIAQANLAAAEAELARLRKVADDER